MVWQGQLSSNVLTGVPWKRNWYLHKKGVRHVGRTEAHGSGKQSRRKEGIGKWDGVDADREAEWGAEED